MTPETCLCFDVREAKKKLATEISDLQSQLAKVRLMQRAEHRRAVAMGGGSFHLTLQTMINHGSS